MKYQLHSDPSEGLILWQVSATMFLLLWIFEMLTLVTLNLILCCDHSLELSLQHMIKWRWKEIIKKMLNVFSVICSSGMFDIMANMTVLVRGSFQCLPIVCWVYMYNVIYFALKITKFHCFNPIKMFANTCMIRLSNS